ncbi:hypothetical protein B566_EDAN014796, partial [Ephemera danica]
MEKFPQLLNQKDSHGCTALHYACKHNHSDVVKLLLSHDNCQINLHNDEQENPLHYSSNRNNLEVMKMLLDRDISLLNIKNKKGQTLLHLKLSQNICLRLGADVNIKDNDNRTPLELE